MQTTPVMCKSEFTGDGLLRHDDRRLTQKANSACGRSAALGRAPIDEGLERFLTGPVH